jgi:hypothetical protein
MKLKRSRITCLQDPVSRLVLAKLTTDEEQAWVGVEKSYP